MKTRRSIHTKKTQKKISFSRKKKSFSRKKKLFNNKRKTKRHYSRLNNRNRKNKKIEKTEHYKLKGGMRFGEWARKLSRRFTTRPRGRIQIDEPDEEDGVSALEKVYINYTEDFNTLKKKHSKSWTKIHDKLHKIIENKNMDNLTGVIQELKNDPDITLTPILDYIVLTMDYYSIKDQFELYDIIDESPDVIIKEEINKFSEPYVLFAIKVVETIKSIFTDMSGEDSTKLEEFKEIYSHENFKNIADDIMVNYMSLKKNAPLLER